MDKMSKQRYIELLAGYINSLSRRENGILDLNSCIKMFGGTLIECNGLCENQEIARIEVDREYRDRFVILHNKEIDDNNKRFAIAHELGHFFLHMLHKDDAGKPALREKVYYLGKEYSDATIHTLEMEADEFAANLLMPKELFVKKVNECKDGQEVNVAEIARYFGVSEQQASLRGVSLSMWK